MGLFKNIKAGLQSAMQPPTPEEIEASLAQLTPEQRAAYEANQAQVAEGQAAAQASWQEARAISQEARAISQEARILDGPAGDHLHGPGMDDSNSPEAMMARYQAEGGGSLIRQAFKESMSGFGQALKETVSGGKVDEIEDPQLRAQAAAEALAARTAARQPYLGPSHPAVAITRIPTRGKTQVEQLLAFLRDSGLSSRPDQVFGAYRVPDRISQTLTPHSEGGRLVEWDIVHVPGAEQGGGGAEVVDAWFPAAEQWVGRRVGEPTVLDEDLGAAYCLQAGVGPEACLGIARHGNFIHRTWDDGAEDSSPITPQIVGVHVLHPAGLGTGVVEQMAAAAPLPLGPEATAGVHTEVLNVGAIRAVTHSRNQDPIPIPSPFPYLPGTPQELLVMYLEVVGIAADDCYGAQVTRHHLAELNGRMGAGTTNMGPSQPCADGKDRMRLHGAEHVVVTYRDAPAYVEGRARWAAYQQEVLMAHLERGTHVREPVPSPDLADGLSNPLLRAAAHVADAVDRVDQLISGRRPNPVRYCWPPLE